MLDQNPRYQYEHIITDTDINIDIYIDVYVCISINICMFMEINIHIDIDISIYVQLNRQIYLCVFVHVCMCMCVCIVRKKEMCAYAQVQYIGIQFFICLLKRLRGNDTIVAISISSIEILLAKYQSLIKRNKVSLEKCLITVLGQGKLQDDPGASCSTRKYERSEKEEPLV